MNPTTETKPRRSIWSVTQHCPGEVPERFGTYAAYTALEAMEIAQTQAQRTDCTWSAEQIGGARK